jgi:GxxExxY protein
MNADFQKTNKDPQTHAIIGAAMEVHRQRGPGFLEAVYQEALAIEPANREVAFQGEVPLPIFYKGVRLQCGYRADFLCFDEVVAELKAVGQLTGADEAQSAVKLNETNLAGV